MSFNIRDALTRGRFAAGVIAAASFAAAATPAIATAQGRQSRSIPFLESQDPRMPDLDVADAMRRGFRLFGKAEIEPPSIALPVRASRSNLESCFRPSGESIKQRTRLK